MTDFILGVFEITIGMSLFIALLLIGLKLFGSKFTAKCRYIIWALVMIRLAIPFSFGLLPTLIEIPIDTELVQSEDLSSVLSENTDSVTSVQPSDPGDVVVTPTTPSTPVFPNVDTANPGSTPILPVTPTVPGDQAEPVIPSDPVIETPTEQPVSLRQILDIASIVYLTGAAIFLEWSLVSYFIYTRKILRSAKAADERTQKIFSTICKKYGIKKQPTLLVASGIHSPAAFGIFRRKIVLPDIAFSENGLVGTLAHEVTHCKRGDLYVKLVELIACSLNWFNPLVHIAAFQCEMEMELSCDEKVLAGSSDAARAAYGEVMLDIIRRCRRNNGALTTHFNPKKSAVTARFKNILYGSGKRRGRILIGICLVLCILAGAFVACQTGDDLPDDAVEDSKVGIITENLSDFLTEEQIALYETAGMIYPLFNGHSYSINILHLILEGASFEEQNNYIVAHNTGSEGIYKIDQVSYLPSYGEYDNFDEFRALCTSVFTEEYFEELNQGSKYASFIDHNGKLYNIDAAKGGQFGYAPDEFPDEYEVVEMSDEVIVFNVTGHYKSSNVDPDFTLTEETFTVKMVLTENGWRFSKFAYAGLDEPPSIKDSDASVQTEVIEYTKKLAKYFRDPVESISELREHQSLWEFLVNSIYELYEKELVTLSEVTEKDYYPQYNIPYIYMHKAAELLLGIENGLPEKLMSKDYHWNKDIDAFLYSPFSPPMYVTDCIRSEISEDGIYHITVKISRVEEDEALAVNTYSFKLVEDEEFGKLYQLLAIKKEEMEQIAVENDPFDPDTFFAASNPNMSADLLFWHRMFPAADNAYLYFCAIRSFNSTMTAYSDALPKEFRIYWTRNGENFTAAEAELPDDLQYDSVCPVVVTDNGGGSGETEFIVQLTHGEKIFYASFDNFTWGDAQDAFTFLYRGILSDEEVNNLKAQYPDAFRKAEKFYWNYTLADFKNENPGSGLVYEGYTVEYTCESPYAGAFDFHIHLPQLNSNALYAEKWNYLYQEYDVQFGDYLRKTVHGTNTDYYVYITYDTVTTGDVVTIYIVKTHGILASGASTLDYDIYHYNMKTDRFLSTDEFIAYYAEGQFADYTVSDIVKFMNELCITTDEAGNPYPLTEKDIRGVIPSVYGDGKFDVVYHGYTVEGYHATRMLFSPYPTYGSKHQYTYRLTYHDYVDCEDKEMYGTPTGYRLLINHRVVGEYDAGYYVDCLFTEDIAEVPESYSLSEHGGYYTLVNQDAYGNMYVVVDHETNWGHLNAWIPFDMSGTAQDYYRGIHYKYFSYDRILNGINDSVNRNIAEMVTQVLHACRAGKDPNGLLPDSETLYIPYPLDAVRQDPTPEEVGEILKNTSVGESGIINFSMDLGDCWRMILPIDIGIFGESVQAYFTGVYYAHGTPVEKKNAAEQTGQTDLQNLYQSILEDKTLVYSLSGEQGMYLSETFQSPNYTHHIIQYSIVDLNGDGTPELVCLTSSGNYTILHVEDNKVYAHSRAYRSFMELKEDGTFVWSGGASDWGIGRIDFDRYNQTRENIAFCRYDYDSNTEVYSVGNREASKEEFDACYAAQGQKPDAVWHEWTAQQETSAQPIDFSSIDGDWYHSFNYENWYAFYGLNFHSKTAEMQFDHGLYESEYDNRYSGTYTVDSTTQEITAVLHDDSTLHQDSDITLKFTLVVRTDGDEPTLVMHISSCNVEKYQHLVGQDLEFTREFGYAELEYQAAQNYYQIWYDKELTIDVLLDKSAVKKDIAKEVREATGMDLLVPSLTWEYTADEDRFPLRFFITDNGGKKMVETNIIRYKDEKDGMEKYAVEVNPTVISVE